MWRTRDWVSQVNIHVIIYGNLVMLILSKIVYRHFIFINAFEMEVIKITPKLKGFPIKIPKLNG